MIKDKQLRTPVLFLVFNRLDVTKRVFKEIQKVKPKKLYIAADGSRNQEEKKKTDSVRKYILDNINWECDIKTLFREKNLGCKYAGSGAINWFFKNEKQGIILEDDCLPNRSFFMFCEEMLKLYKDDGRIMQISGTNIEGKSKIYDDYFLSKRFNNWGWATWRRAWKHYDVKMSKWNKVNKNKFMRKLNYGLIDKIKSRRLYSLTSRGKIDTWDYQWDFICHLNNSFSIVPKVNLIKNLGFSEGTHTTNYNELEKTLSRKELSFPLKTNGKLLYKKDYDTKYFKFFKNNFYGKLINYFKSSGFLRTKLVNYLKYKLKISL